MVLLSSHHTKPHALHSRRGAFSMFLGIALYRTAWLVSSGLDELPAYRALLLDLHGGNPRFLGGDFLFAPMREMKLRSNQIKLRKYEVISPNYFSFPPEESNNSSLGTEQFLRWNRRVPPLELKSSKRGTIFGTRMCQK